MAQALLKLPLSLLALLVVGFPMLVAVVGLLIVRSHVSHPRLQPHHDVAGYIYSGLAVLYAVLLAFVVVIVWQQFNATDIRVHQEANELGNLFRAVQSFPAPVQDEMLHAVRSYATSVIKKEWADMGRGIENAEAEAAYNQLWQIIRTLAPQSPAEINWHAALLQSLTTLSNYRRDRLADSRAVLPTVLWVVLLSGGVINLGYTYLFGVKSLAVHLIITMALTAMTTLLLLVILILDHPFAGSFRVETEPFARVLRRVNQLTPAPPERTF